MNVGCVRERSHGMNTSFTGHLSWVKGAWQKGELGGVGKKEGSVVVWRCISAISHFYHGPEKKLFCKYNLSASFLAPDLILFSVLYS